MRNLINTHTHTHTHTHNEDIYDRGWHLRAPGRSIRKARCLYTVSEGREGAKGAGGGIRDGNVVEGGNGDVNCDGDGDGVGLRTGWK